jgi:hypothetical protein
MLVDWKKAQKKSVRTARWSMTMAKVRISRALARTRWQTVTFLGRAGRESVGIVDLIAIRKDHGRPIHGTKKGDNFQIILIQVKGYGRWPAAPCCGSTPPRRAGIAGDVEKGKVRKFPTTATEAYRGSSRLDGSGRPELDLQIGFICEDRIRQNSEGPGKVGDHLT